MNTDPSQNEDDLDFGPTLKGLQPGRKGFGRYSLIRQLGRGGMGVVWLGQDEKLEGRKVALKFLPEVVQGDPVAINDLKKETMQCLNLTHPSIVRIYDWVEDGTSAAISMEYVAGDTLTARRLKQDKEVFEVGEINEWIGQACEGLEYAHGRKVVHRDLKPANLMIDGEGKLRVLDFGIAGSLTDSMSRLTAAGAPTSGTLVYMSPQQAMGYPPTATDDVYALGATIYELLTGRPPFYRGNVQHQIETLEAPSMEERRKQLDIEDAGKIPLLWEDAVASCLAKDPQERPESAAALWAELSGGAVQGRKKKALVKKCQKPAVEKSAAGKKWVTMAAVMVLAAGVAAGWWYGVEAPKRAAVALADLEAKRAADELAKAEARQVALMNTPVLLEIGTEPGGAKIRVDGVEVGTTGGDGLLRYKALPGNHLVVAEYESWPSQQREVELKGGEENARVTFTFEPVEVELLSEPLGAEVREVGDGKVLGVTPLTGLQGMQPGEMKWELSLAGYEKIEYRAMLKAGNNAAVRVVMKRLPKTAKQLASERLGVATKENPYMNSLGMEFVPVPGKPGVLMCRTETRVRDFRAYVEATDYVQSGGAYVLKVKKNEKGEYLTPWELDKDASWERPGFEQGEDHPVVCVSWNEAQAFCKWLTQQNPGYTYRLPSDGEWSAAVGSIDKYPWGNEWPPSRGDEGNFKGKEVNITSANWSVIEGGYADRHPRTASVGSYRVNRFGFYDLGGNVSEWCEDWFRKEMQGSYALEYCKKQGCVHMEPEGYVMRGGSWAHAEEYNYFLSTRMSNIATRRDDNFGFRVVVNDSGYVNRDGVPEVDQMLRAYINMATALSKDDLASAKRHAALLLEGKGRRLLSSEFDSLTTAKTLKEFRKEFEMLSKQVIGIAQGREGYYVLHCPLVKGGGGDWLQTSSEKPFNPYLGRKMLHCGGLKK